MQSNHYTPVSISRKGFHFVHFMSHHFEPLLLSLVVLTGIIGSVYIFGQNIFQENPGQAGGSNHLGTSTVMALFSESESREASGNFDDYVRIEQDIKAGESFQFEFLQDPRASRYVMEMGDGVRLIVTQRNLMYNYSAPGKYVIELKEIKGGLLNLLGTKKVKVKNP